MSEPETILGIPVEEYQHLEKVTAEWSKIWGRSLAIVPPTEIETANCDLNITIVDGTPTGPGISGVYSDGELLGTFKGGYPPFILYLGKREFSNPLYLSLVFEALFTSFRGRLDKKLMEARLRSDMSQHFLRNLQAQEQDVKLRVRNLGTELTKQTTDLINTRRLLQNWAQQWDNVVLFSEQLGLIRSLGRIMIYTPGALTIATNPIRCGGHLFGRYKVVVDITQRVVRITALDAKWPTGIRTPMFHPHVDSDGSPCFGNAEEPIRVALAEGKFGTAALLIREFLESYNPRGAYLRIDAEPDEEDIEEDDEEGPDYDECLDSSATRDCVRCSDSDCPHRVDAVDRCIEAHDLSECTSCSISTCPHRAVAWEECYQARTPDRPWACISCDAVSCPHHRSIGDCTPADSSDCGQCPIHNDCPSRSRAAARPWENPCLNCDSLDCEDRITFARCRETTPSNVCPDCPNTTECTEDMRRDCRPVPAQLWKCIECQLSCSYRISMERCAAIEAFPEICNVCPLNSNCRRRSQ